MNYAAVYKLSCKTMHASANCFASLTTGVTVPLMRFQASTGSWSLSRWRAWAKTRNPCKRQASIRDSMHTLHELAADVAVFCKKVPKWEPTLCNDCSQHYVSEASYISIHPAIKYFCWHCPLDRLCPACSLIFGSCCPCGEQSTGMGCASSNAPKWTGPAVQCS